MLFFGTSTILVFEKTTFRPGLPWSSSGRGSGPKQSGTVSIQLCASFSVLKHWEGCQWLVSGGATWKKLPDELLEVFFFPSIRKRLQKDRVIPIVRCHFISPCAFFYFITSHGLLLFQHTLGFHLVLGAGHQFWILTTVTCVVVVLVCQAVDFYFA